MVLLTHLQSEICSRAPFPALGVEKPSCLQRSFSVNDVPVVEGFSVYNAQPKWHLWPCRRHVFAEVHDPLHLISMVWIDSRSRRVSGSDGSVGSTRDICSLL
jgi:hypothetical protein